MEKEFNTGREAGQSVQIANMIGKRLTRKNSISDVPENLDLARDHRPPTRHDYNPHIYGSDHSRPMTASSMNFSLDSSRGKIPDDEFIKVYKDANTTPDEPDNNEKPKKKWKKYLIVSTVVVIVCVIALSVALAITLRTSGPRTKTKTQPTAGPEATTGLPSTTFTTPPVPVIVIESENITYGPEATTGLPTTTFTTPPVPVIVIESENITYGGSWSSWYSWSECSRSCGVGFQLRNRSCDSSELECQGVASHQRRCNTALCSVQEPDGIWTTWNAWTVCSHSCSTGSQLRERTCQSLNDSSVVLDTCAGLSDQSRNCNDFPCPDCSIDCTDGELSADCTHCECSTTITGQVLSDSNLPLDNVTISPPNAPYVTLTTTLTGGYFTLHEACINDVYLFSRNGYADTELILYELTMNVTMQQVVTLQMVSNPQSVMRVSGDAVQLCCEAYGIPPPDYYEWMYNGDVVTTDQSTGDSTYVINHVTTEHTGYYTCRASNDYGAIYSAVATLLVEDSADDFCASQPQPNIIALPSGCQYENATTIDKGLCETNACSGGSGQGCVRSRTRCCGPTSLTRVDVDCVDYTIPVYMVTACGCTTCRITGVTIYGFAGSRDGSPLQYGDIYWSGMLMTNTSYDGTFSFTVETTITRTSVLFIDSYNATFLDSTYVFEMPSNGADSQFIRVTMLRRGQIFNFNASDEYTLEFNDTSVDIPPGSFYTNDGQPYEGEVTVSVTTINPADIDEIASAPGDFSIVDEEGDSQRLLSYGMFGMAFEDNNGSRLSIPGEITITVPGDILGDLNDTSTVRVWTLNPSTGLWQFASDLEESDGSERRRKRQIRPGGWGQRSVQATIRGIPINVQWFNFDAISTQTCIVKVRLFENDRYNEVDQMHYGRVSLVLQDNNGYNSLSSNRVRTDTGYNGYCMVMPCESSRSNSLDSFRGYIFADFGTEELIPAQPSIESNGLQNSQFDLDTVLDYVVIDNKIQVDFNERLVHAEGLGPFYDWERKWPYSSACSNAAFQANHFRFSKYVNCLVENDFYNNVPGDENTAFPLHLLLWYDVTSYFPYDTEQSPPLRSFYAFKSCYIKVLAPRDTLIEALSYVSDERHLFYSADVSALYGVRQDCATDGAVCLQVRVPGNPRIAPYESEHAVDNEESTLITVRTVDRSYPVIGITEDLLTAQQTRDYILTDASAAELNFQMYLRHGTSYGSNLGIYCHQGPTEEVAEQALYMCRHGQRSTAEASRVPRVDTTTLSWAVEFGLSPLATGLTCKQLYDAGVTVDGIYTINPDGMGEFDAYCELNPTRSDGSVGGGWTVIQRRVDASVNFYRDWAEYVEGFGDLDGNLWLGLDKLARLTGQGPVELHVYLETFEQTFAYAHYSHFDISDNSDNYRLSVSGYDGTAGDSLSYHNSYQFSTFDRDHDIWSSNCAERYEGAWWYSICHSSHLNGLYLAGAHTSYANGINWSNYRGQYYSLKTTIMKIRPL